MSSGTDLISGWLSGSPFRLHLGIEVAALTDGHAELVLPFSEAVCTMGDVVHGGAISALIDTAATAAAWAGAEVPENVRGSTVALDVVFVAAARSSNLTAEADVIKRGKNLCYCDVVVRDAGNQTVAKGLVTYKLG